MNLWMSSDLDLYSYYMIRLRQPPRGLEGPAVGCAGLAERVATGEKRSFSTAGELIGVLTLWAEQDVARRAELGAPTARVASGRD